MGLIHVEATDVIAAPPEKIYAILTDYQVGHPAILPKPYFKELLVEKGGQGAGTVTIGKMLVLGREYKLHQLVSEPEPGRLLMETGIETGEVTTFKLEPLIADTQTRVTIATDFIASPGLTGIFEKLAIPLITGSIYKKELKQLASYVGNRG